MLDYRKRKNNYCKLYEKNVSYFVFFMVFIGEKFDLKLFHDAIVLESMVPMAILESIVDQFIEDNK